MPYSGKLSREKSFANLWKIQFSRKLLQIVSFCCANRCHAPKISQKITFTNSHKTAKFAKVFSLESLPLYGMLVPHLVKDIFGIKNVQNFALQVCSKQWSSTYDTLLNDLTVPTLFSRRKSLKLCTQFSIFTGKLSSAEYMSECNSVKLVILTTEWLPWLQTSWRNSGSVIC